MLAASTNMARTKLTWRHVLPLLVLGFFVASFFIGRAVDPSYIEIARSPYGLFTYFVVTMLTAFIPSMATLPIVFTATVIWGPWLAGLVAISGWTIGAIIEYGAAYYSISTMLKWFEAGRLNEKIDRLRRSVNFWQVLVARLFIPPFVFGIVKTDFKQFIITSILAYVPLAAAGVGGGTFLAAYIDNIQPLIVGAAFVLLIFSIDFLFARRTHN